jgi:hypothetical protein
MHKHAYIVHFNAHGVKDSPGSAAARCTAGYLVVMV